MVEKLSDTDLAKETIASSPEITVQAEEISEDKPLKDAKETVSEGFSEHEAERNARLLSQGCNSVYRSYSGADLKMDQVSAFEELGTEIFKSLNEFGVPKAVKLVLLTAIVSLPFVPSVIKIFKGDKNNGNIDHSPAGD